MLHRNSQKRIYLERCVYFITTNTHARYPYFQEDILCELFIEELLLCQKLKEFNLLGYKVNPEHVHLMFQPNERHDFSEIMHFLKKNASYNINKLLSSSNPQKRRCVTSPLEPLDELVTANAAIPPFSNTAIKDMDHKIQQLKKRYDIKYSKGSSGSPHFKWQKSFHHHIIEDQRDLYNHLMYIKGQWIKHGQDENKWCYIREDIDTCLP